MEPTDGSALDRAPSSISQDVVTSLDDGGDSAGIDVSPSSVTADDDADAAAAASTSGDAGSGGEAAAVQQTSFFKVSAYMP